MDEGRLVTGNQKYVDAWRAMTAAVNSHARQQNGRTQYPTMFGAQGWMNLLKSALKIGAVFAAMLYAVWPEMTAITEAGRLEAAGLLAITQSIAGRLLLASIVVVGLIAGLDFLWQRWSFMRRMRMSRR